MKQLLLNSILFISALSAIAQTTTCDIKNHTGSAIKTHTDSKIGIYGNLINDGSFTDTDGTSEVGFYNTNTGLTISGTNSPEFATLITSLPNDLSVQVKTNVTTGLLFLNGRIITPRDTPEVSIDLLNTDVVLGEGDPSHVDGYTSYRGGNAYVFPVGDDLRLRTISVDATASQNTTRAAYFFEDPNTPSTFSTDFDRAEKNDDVAKVTPLEFWDLEGNTPTAVTLTWDLLSNIDDLVLESDLRELIVVGWSKAEQKWVNLGNENVSGNTVSGQITSIIFNPDDFEVITIAGTEKPDVINPNDDLEFFNAISDDDDDINSYFKIEGIDQFPNNTLKIYNRWGVEVYSKNGYHDDPDKGDLFVGKSNGRVTIEEDDRLPVGTYFYVLNYEVDARGGKKSKAGYLYIQR